MPYRTANFTMAQAYWNIGRVIVEEEQRGRERAGYGQEIIKQLSKKLIRKHGKGFNTTNLWYIRQYYSIFQNFHALRGRLSWTHYRLLLKVEKDQARQFYMQEAIDCNWSTRSLKRQINNLYYDRMIMIQNTIIVKNEATEKTNQQEPQDIIKNTYVLEFLGLKTIQIFGKANWRKL